MSGTFQYLDQVLFAALPYIVFVTFILATVQRYRAQSFTYSSLSTQFLENQQHFWGMTPFHYGILFILAGHVVAFLLPRQLLLWNSQPLRLYVLEVSALAFGVLTVVGMISIIYRRITNLKVRTVTTASDWILYVLLLVQAATGVYIAILHPWGSSWFATSATPYLWSLIKLSPDMGYVVAMPFMVKLHIVCAYLVIGFFPFTRLVHVLVIPNPYLWRKPQLVRWSGPRKGINNNG